MPVSLVVAADQVPSVLQYLLGLVAVGELIIPNFGRLMRAGLLGGAAAGEESG